MKLAALLLIAVSASAQLVEVKVNRGQSQQSAKFDLKPKTIIESITCRNPDTTVPPDGIVVLEPGESSLCLVRLNQAARIGSAGVPLQVAVPVELSAPAVVTVPPGLASVEFMVDYLDPPTIPLANAQPLPLLAMAHTMWALGIPTQRHVEIVKR